MVATSAGVRRESMCIWILWMDVEYWERRNKIGILELRCKVSFNIAFNILTQIGEKIFVAFFVICFVNMNYLFFNIRVFPAVIWKINPFSVIKKSCFVVVLFLFVGLQLEMTMIKLEENV